MVGGWQGTIYYRYAEEYGEKSMAITLGKAFQVGDSFEHHYDFGSTTELKIKVLKEREGSIGRPSLRLLSPQ
ncbi:MAG: hypothetical protein R2865_10495 [Deinococcales bacterium]